MIGCLCVFYWLFRTGAGWVSLYITVHSLSEKKKAPFLSNNTEMFPASFLWPFTSTVLLISFCGELCVFFYFPFLCLQLSITLNAMTWQGKLGYGAFTTASLMLPTAL